MRVRSWSSVLAFLVLGACATPGLETPAPPPASATESVDIPGAIRWVRASAEYQALAHQVYTIAAERVRDTAQTLKGVPWGVIMDADETVLDNSEYQRARAALDSAYTVESWAEWVNEARAPAVPGAVAFAGEVRRLGGRVIIVTNRDDALCERTRANLHRIRMDPDLVLCRTPGESDKNPRFEGVQRGTASPDLPALRVVAWVGDNIQDFPGLTQASPRDSSTYSRFGRVYFILPNPMYGSWERNGAG